MKIISQFRHFLEILFPSRCVVCGVRIAIESCGALCSSCFDEIRFVENPVCRMCGIEVTGEKHRSFLCARCLHRAPPFAIARSLVRYGPVVQQLIHKLKYNADTSVVTGLIEVVSSCDLSLFDDCDLILPVPLHRKRLQKRRLNQAVIMARILFSDRLELLRVDGLVRTVNTNAQTRLSGEERRQNLRDAFSVKCRKNIENKMVCLVDDVFTTGTTVSECSKILLHEGAREVRVLTFARVAVSKSG